MAAKTTKKKRGMSDEHKAALAEGREQGRAVRVYLEALEAHKPKRGRKRTPESIKKRLTAIADELHTADPMTRLLMTQEQVDLDNELAQMDSGVDLTELEAEFIESAAGYSDRKGITYDTWRKMGIAPATLKAAGIRR